MFLFTWFLSGFIALLFCLIHDLRGKEYDPNYFDKEGLVTCGIVFLCGYLSVVIVVGMLIDNNRDTFTRWIYDVINIGKDND